MLGASQPSVTLALGDRTPGTCTPVHLPHPQNWIFFKKLKNKVLFAVYQALQRSKGEGEKKEHSFGQKLVTNDSAVSPQSKQQKTGSQGVKT